MSLLEIEEQLKAFEDEAIEAFQSVSDLKELENLRQKYLGKKGTLKTFQKGMGQLDQSERPKLGQLTNGVQERLENALTRRKEDLFEEELLTRLEGEKIDVTLPGSCTGIGHIHPLSQITEEIIQIFYSMGFTVADGPEIETDYYNFDALNTPDNHPARDEQDTFYTNVGPKVLLRSQTSTVQIRVMEDKKPPLRIISPGRVYRNEEINARKYPLFHQVEGLLIDKDVSFGQLKGTLTAFIQALFQKPVKTRFRPDFFPFTEPSAELDSQCLFCMGAGCRTCGNRGWLELLGCGMVDPNVLQGVGIDPEEWSGFAFGMGVERLAMLKYGINDIRYFFNNDMRFLKQF